MGAPAAWITEQIVPVPKNIFSAAIQRLSSGQDHRSPLTLALGSKGYHPHRRPL